MSMGLELLLSWGAVCDKCDHRWVSRSPDVPALCPKCKSTRWNHLSGPPTTARFPRKMEHSLAYIAAEAHFLGEQVNKERFSESLKGKAVEPAKNSTGPDTSGSVRGDDQDESSLWVEDGTEFDPRDNCLWLMEKNLETKRRRPKRLLDNTLAA